MVDNLVRHDMDNYGMSTIISDLLICKDCELVERSAVDCGVLNRDKLDSHSNRFAIFKG